MRKTNPVAEDAMLRLSAVQRLLEIEVSKLLREADETSVIVIGGHKRIASIREMLKAAEVCRAEFRAAVTGVEP